MNNQPNEWPRAILHLDMDAFFVNVYLLDHPEDIGLPIAVGGRPDQRGVIASASYEARSFGVRSAMPASKALQLCPQIKFVNHNWEQIKQSSEEVMNILEQYGTIEQMSVDEAFVDISAHPNPETLAIAIRERVKQETRLPASVGLATSKLVAKVASDHDKPVGCTIIPPGEEAAFLAPLSVRALWGIGPQTAVKLTTVGIDFCGQLAAADRLTLYPLFGRHWEELVERASGIDPRPVAPYDGPPKTISQEWTFNEDITAPEPIEHHLHQMVDHLSEQLEKRNLLTSTIRIKFRWADFTTFTRQKSFSEPTMDPKLIYQLAQTIWFAHWPPGQPVRLIGVAVANLSLQTIVQLPLPFETNSSQNH